MGCSSSTEVVVDPHTGQTKTKKRLGGAYPGQRPSNGAYASPVGETAHFQTVPGGNALQLVQGGLPQPQTGVNAPQYIQVTLPDGVSSGQTIHVQAPDGAINAIVVPAGYGPGSSFTVEFAPSETSPSKEAAEPYNVAPPVNQTTGDDGFASAFGSPQFAPATTNFSDSYYSQYPTTGGAQPVTAVPVNSYNKY